jgi:hypothetical protein
MQSNTGKLKIIKKVIPNGMADANLTQDIDNVQYVVQISV